jgi:hypothetical protein
MSQVSGGRCEFGMSYNGLELPGQLGGQPSNAYPIPPDPSMDSGPFVKSGVDEGSGYKGSSQSNLQTEWHVHAWFVSRAFIY